MNPNAMRQDNSESSVESAKPILAENNIYIINRNTSQAGSTAESNAIMKSYNYNFDTLPTPGELVQLSNKITPPSLIGLKLHRDDPFHIDFIVHPGDVEIDEQELTSEAEKLIKYFLTALTIPEEHLWVNLSPAERDNIISDDFVSTQMGRDFLLQDYLLKQLTASLTYPETELGERYWSFIYRKARETFGDDEIPANTFNKVWIIPDEASVILTGDTALISDSRLTVQTEIEHFGDKMQQSPSYSNSISGDQDIDVNMRQIASEATKALIIPELIKEVNEGSHFATVRQAYSALILATWYKRTLKNSLLTKTATKKTSLSGMALNEGQVKFSKQIYERYIKAYDSGVYNYIREDEKFDKSDIIPRKYFAGGITATGLGKTLGKIHQPKVFRYPHALGGAVFLVHASLFSPVGDVMADQNISPASMGSSTTVIEPYSKDAPGGIDFGADFEIRETSDTPFEFYSDSLAEAPDNVVFSPKILRIIEFNRLNDVIAIKSHK